MFDAKLGRPECLVMCFDRGDPDNVFLAADAIFCLVRNSPRLRRLFQVTEWRNIAKTTVWFSSKMEKFMIQMTWPDDGLLDDTWLKVSVGRIDGDVFSAEVIRESLRRHAVALIVRKC